MEETKTERDRQTDKREKRKRAQRHREKDRDERHSGIETEGERQGRAPPPRDRRGDRMIISRRGGGGSGRVRASSSHSHAANLKPHSPRSLHRTGSLLPVDQGPQGILAGQEDLRGQPPPVGDRGTEVMTNAKSEPG